MPASTLPEIKTSNIQNAILRVITYFDIFDYPPTIKEIHRYLECRSSLNALPQEISLMADQIEREGAHYCVKGRHEIFSTRRQRRQISANLWKKSLPCLKLTQAIPFLRFVGVSGSLAVNNADDAADVDIIFIAAEGKLKISYFFLCLLKKIFKNFELCPSLGLDISDLEIKRQHLYIAHEINQITPLWGSVAYKKFVQANTWTLQLLPNCSIESNGFSRIILNESPFLKFLQYSLEFLLSGRFNPVGSMLSKIHSWSLQRKKISCTKINCFQTKNSSSGHRHHDARIIEEYNNRLKQNDLEL